jgi:hypothetical protein
MLRAARVVIGSRPSRRLWLQLSLVSASSSVACRWAATSTASSLVLQPEIVTLLVSLMWHADGTADGRMRGQQATEPDP